ncbi:hypothetical protein ACFC09_21595 [Streptomyces sp. NPDC056161]|uniref:NADase-type glycan-binding domain-containing protein n=1 Tax=Streptomyces sp. NPDC056161 TaxID=3345732 RepID=UPI0035D974CB
MICPDCGHRNPPGTRFCASCQAFLAWEEAERAGQPAPAADPAVAPPPEAPPPTPPTSDATSPATTAPPAARTGPPQPATPPDIAARRPDDPPQHPPDHAPDHRTGALADPPPEAPPRPDTPPRRPGRPCPDCRAENPHDRRLCVRCGALLDPAGPPVQAPRPPWWRRILPRRERRPLAAGSRPGRRVWRRPRLTLPVVLVVLLVAAWFARAQLTQLFTFAEDNTGDPKPLHPAQVRASSQTPSHRAQAAFDSLSNRYWAPAVPGSGTGQYLEADFERPVRLQKLLITSGSSTKPDEFLGQARPSRITVTLVSSQGERTTESLNLSDAPGQQSFDVRGTDVTRVRLTVNAAYAARQDRRVAIAEVEFFGGQ